MRNEIYDKRGRLTGLEALRFVCAFGVLLFHYHQFSFRPGRGFVLSPDRLLPFHEILQVFYVNGAFAVRVFWCISGFIFFWKYQDAISEHRLGFKKFAILRFTRLYPLHFATLLLVTGLQLIYFRRFGSYFVYQVNDALHFVMQLAMASNWNPTQPYSFNGPIWSVSLEVLVYILFFFVAAYFTKSWKLNVLIVTFTIVLLPIPSLLPVRRLFECIGFFYAGGLSAYAYRILLFGGMLETRKARIKANFWVLVGLAAISIVFFVLHIFFRGTGDLKLEFLLLATPLMLMILAQDLPVPEQVRGHIDTAGNMTYASYLLHFPIQILIALVAGEEGRWLSVYNPWLLVGFIVGTFTLAYFVYRYFEAPVQTRLRKSLLRSGTGSSLVGV
jgi:peptidoglycan/LPS O-acetylase OafA/YrhL